MIGQKAHAVVLSCALVPCLWLGACSDKPSAQKLPNSATIVALGDSLTYGYGVDKSQSYPAILAKKSGKKIINAGINGNTSADVLARLDEIIAKKPDLVLLGVGGNDVLRRVPSHQTQDNLTAIIKKLQQHHIAVVLIAQPHLSASALFGRASDNPIYARVAKDTGVPLLDGAWSRVLSDDKLKSDQIHGNADGYKEFADELYDFLKQVGYI